MNEEKWLYLAVPHAAGGEGEAMLEALNENVIGPVDCNVTRFEDELSEHFNGLYIACTDSGTAALHLSLISYDIGKGDTVFIPDFSFIASVNPILYTGATPVFIDTERESLGLSLNALSKALENHKPKAIVVPDLFGAAANYNEIKKLLQEKSKDAIIIEDACESLGGEIFDEKNKTWNPIGLSGDISILSFNTNKIITAGGGGAVISKDEEMIKNMRNLSKQNRKPGGFYNYNGIGYNYRMNNIGAGAGRVQFKSLAKRVAAKRKIHGYYKTHIDILGGDAKGFKLFEPPEWTRSSYWFNMLFLPNENTNMAKLVDYMSDAKIEVRPAWGQLSKAPQFEGAALYTDEDFSLAKKISNSAILLPSDISLSEEDVLRTYGKLKNFFS